ncbi:arylsulfatase [Novosphingobium mangrovi (ex Huang et al. 2023)]|uniref:Arylsulfatase n=1 Tax=Novosphingobium mangrovi (ex Huang et al. 2023) TaxID=2976432 RepID=A0ABT2HZM5_9SPHN|nr:arylsulfatase [Novosphingobium mangrovi (ex Huang et al. 2023)]MCT2398003.1 arylsulfatase [Novosphingobium mangrovi (ex Huang et al. 2023)]
MTGTKRRSALRMLALAGTMLGACLVAQPPAGARDTAPAQSGEVQARQAPNVLVWMVDDVGFGQISSFGGLVDTPNIDRVASMGLRYANYHTAPICSAARASFLTGRMPHTIHVGGHAAGATASPGYDAKIPAEDGTIAANLHAAGYATFAVGKWDHLPTEEATPAGPYTHWALGQGFDRFYGFLAADADNFNPILVNDLTPVARPRTPDYHLSADLADKAIGMIDVSHARDPARPFFMYWATGAAHAPHHAPPEWIAKYKGKFDQGWDKVREQVLAREIAQGLVPEGTKMAPPPEGMPAWDSLSPEAQKLYARQMEVFAASLAYADAQFGRILDHLQAMGELDNTMIVIVSDNGASAEGGPNGLFNEAQVTGGQPPSIASNMRFYDDWGGPKTYPHYAYGWALAGDTPFRYWKQTTHEGGTRVPLVIAWPDRIKAQGQVRQNFVHVADIAPTILDALHVPLAPTVNNVAQAPMEGASVAASFTQPGNPRDGRAQYVELYGNKGLWEKGWSIVTTHRTRTWDWNTARTFDEPWELYDLVTDPGETTDLASSQPERVAAMAREFDEQARRYHVYPIHNLSDTAAESMGKALADFRRRKGKWHFPGPVGNIPSTVAPPISMLGFTMTAKLDLPDAKVTAPVFSSGGQMGGIALYLNEGRPELLLRAVDGSGVSVLADKPVPSGASALELDLAKGERGADGLSTYQVTIRSGDAVLVDKPVRFALPWYFGLSETFGVGVDNGSPVLAGAAVDVPFPGKLTDVEFAFDPEARPFPSLGH